MKKIIYLFIIVWFAFQTVSFASEGNINSIDYIINIKNDGMIEITELWSISTLKNTDTILRKINNIIDVEVKEYNLDGSVKLIYDKVDNKLNLESNKIYIDDENIEIKIDNIQNNKYIGITYILNNNIVKYLDCAEMRLKLQDENFKYDCNEITGKIYYENSLLKDSNIWIHSNSNFSISNLDNQINFWVDENKENEDFEIVISMPENIITCQEVINENRKQNLFEEEQKYAEERQILVNEKKEVNIIIFVILVVVLIVIITLIVVIVFRKYKCKE